MNEFLVIRDETLRARALQRILSLDLAKPMKMTLEPYKSNRSLEQNALYWRNLGIISQETGHTSEEIHEWVKCHFLPPQFVEIAGETHEVRHSTAKLKVDEMAELIDRVTSWAQADLGIVIPARDQI